MSNIIPLNFEDNSFPFTEDGWINATEASKHFGKRPNDWLALPETKDYMAAVTRQLNTRESGNLVRTARGRNGGTWIHPDLAVFFARWLSVDFAVRCDRHIKHLIEQGATFRQHENLLSAFVLPAANQWELRFGDDYYLALARITNTRYLGHSRGTPAIYGKLTRRWVYEAVMPADVITEIDSRKRNGDKLHQWLTEGGSITLADQISKVTLIANTSTSLRDFEARCSQMVDGKGQLALLYPPKKGVAA
ncbi:KilA-N domain-containing protein [Halomonas sp. N3-2A]|uniref:KilA-N domain-containing protein n=1 Tax=Halomonas sp. N3-2A TaxID=2014541 RepID=UPI000B5B3A07|nr:KilA-N domain-containing protein [Halomonas sp. N3-2A]ASK18378.1 hypothetical protein CEK60_03235 [Halomonas sp. N3-2A]